MTSKTIRYHYEFTLGDGTQRKFDVRLDSKTLNLVPTKRESCPEWTKLKYFRCPNCSLDEVKHEFCPIAMNLVDLIDFFGSSISYEEVDVLIETEARRYTKHTTLQRGLSSLIGIYMVTSSCPIMEKLKPMVRYHLPFATLNETKYRVMSTYLLAQYFLAKRGKEPDWELKKLVEMYADIRVVNINLCKRLSDVAVQDASLNALNILNSFVETMTFSIDKDMLDEIELLFAAYLR